MTLTETLAELKDDEYVYIGAKNGSGWLTICTKEELEKEIDGISERYRKSKKKSLKSITEDLDTVGERVDEQIEIINKLTKQLDDALARLSYITRDIDANRKKYEYLKDYLDNWKDMRDRDVVETYAHNDVKPVGTSILIKGDEAGKYWTLDEVEADKKGN